MKFGIYRNTSMKRWGFSRLPVRQYLFWLGPVFVLIRTGRQS